MEMTPRVEVEEDSDNNKGSMWDLDQKLDQPMDEEAGRLRNIYREKKFSALLLLRLAFQSLGVVYGDLGTSPLYVFYNTFPRGINDSEDVIGALSLIIYSLTLIPLLKYVFIVCKANDNGQGGTFALYSLLCRHAKVRTIPNQHRTDEELTTYSRSTFHEQSFAAKTKRWLERYAFRRSALLILVLVGTCMLIGDGILTPAISAAFLVIMYVWHYGTLKRYEFEMHSKVSMAWIVGLGPSLGLVRVPGIGLVYTELARGVPRIFSHFITNLPAIHSVVVFVCVKYLPVYTVPEEERFLVKRIGPKNFHMFRCVARYGYKDLHKKDEDFEKKLFDNLFLFVRLETMMEGCSDSDEYSLYGQQTERSREGLMNDNGNTTSSFADPTISSIDSIVQIKSPVHANFTDEAYNGQKPTMQKETFSSVNGRQEESTDPEKSACDHTQKKEDSVSESTCMVIGDGILTPAISVLSAVQGIKLGHPEMSSGISLL
ncbi:hypothetical protein OIU78_013943 [Salix suchowensis]|nr:hypothetical protein OIU78_013943 [Salix suchowensis]